MAEFVSHNVIKSVVGKSWCRQFTNDDAPLKWRAQACGQAACATAVSSNWGGLISNFSDVFDPPWNPDTHGLGTTPWRVKDILQKRYKVRIANVYGMEQLYSYLKNKVPVIVPLDLTAAKAMVKNFALHWVCVYGATDYNILLSNFFYPGFENDIEAATTTCFGRGSNVCPKGAFLDGWQAWTINAIGMGKRGFAII